MNFKANGGYLGNTQLTLNCQKYHNCWSWQCSEKKTFCHEIPCMWQKRCSLWLLFFQLSTSSWVHHCKRQLLEPSANVHRYQTSFVNKGRSKMTSYKSLAFIKSVFVPFIFLQKNPLKYLSLIIWKILLLQNYWLVLQHLIGVRSNPLRNLP